MLNKPLTEALLACNILVEKNISDLLIDETNNSNLIKAMRYSCLSDGKRIRPFLTVICAEIFGVPALSSINAATAIEFVHNYSLIHDDLPAMDDDDFRRGNLSCHKKFDEATAILSGDALLTYAFEVLASSKTHQDPLIRCELVQTLAKSSGLNGMVGGQMIDLENAGKKISKEQLANLHRQKTGELFMCACEMGAILGRAQQQDRKKLRYYAHDIGLAFQISDDILDHQGEKDKKINLDANSHQKTQENASIVDIVGLKTAKQQLAMLRDQAKQHIESFGEKAQILLELADFITDRES